MVEILKVIGVMTLVLSCSYMALVSGRAEMRAEMRAEHKLEIAKWRLKVADKSGVIGFQDVLLSQCKAKLEAKDG